MHLDNHSKASALFQPGWLLDGQLIQIVAVKFSARFELDGNIIPLDQSADLASGDRYHDDSDTRSLAHANDMVPFKQGFEWLLTGQAQAIAKHRVQDLAVTWMRNGQLQQQKKITLFGTRMWKKSWAGITPGEPSQLADTPLQWELAYGGQFENTEEVLAENPVGQGWFGKQKQKAIGQAMPQIEQQPLLMRAGQKRHPAGFGPIAPHWVPRQAGFLTLNTEASIHGASPYTTKTPADLYNAAPKDQRMEQAPQTGDTLLLSGFYRKAPSLTLTLPTFTPLVFHRSGTSQSKRLTMHWDTLLIDTTEQRLDWVFRGVLPMAAAAENTQIVVNQINVERGAAADYD